MPSVEISADELKELRALAKAAPGLKTALEKSTAELDELVNETVVEAFKELIRRVDILEETVPARLDEVERRLGEVERRLDAMEWRQRKPNFLVANLPESQGESPQTTEKKVKTFLEEKLSLNNIVISNCHRVGKTSGDRPRRVLVATTSPKQKQEVMRRRTKLRGTNIFLDDDVPESLRQQREELRRLALPLAKRKGERLTLSYPFVAARVGQRSYTREELEEESERAADSRTGAAEVPSTSGHAPPASKSNDAQPEADRVDGDGEREKERGKRRRSSSTGDSVGKRRMKQTRIGDFSAKFPPLKRS